MQTESRIKKGFIKAFAVATAIAVVLNVIAFSVSMREEQWNVGFGYLLIAAMLSGALYLLWYSRNRTEPYSWRSGRDDSGDGAGAGEPTENLDQTYGVARSDDEPPRLMDRTDWWRAEFDVDPLPDEVEERGPRDTD